MEFVDNVKADGSAGQDGIHDTLGIDKATFDAVANGGNANDAQYASMKASQEAIAAQIALNGESLRLNTAMAWLQMAMGMSTKLSGR